MFHSKTIISLIETVHIVALHDCCNNIVYSTVKRNTVVYCELFFLSLFSIGKFFILNVRVIIVFDVTLKETQNSKNCIKIAKHKPYVQLFTVCGKLFEDKNITSTNTTLYIFRLWKVFCLENLEQFNFLLHYRHQTFR